MGINLFITHSFKLHQGLKLCMIRGVIIWVPASRELSARLHFSWLESLSLTGKTVCFLWLWGELLPETRKFNHLICLVQVDRWCGAVMRALYRTELVLQPSSPTCLFLLFPLLLFLSCMLSCLSVSGRSYSLLLTHLHSWIPSTNQLPAVYLPSSALQSLPDHPFLSVVTVLRP